MCYTKINTGGSDEAKNELLRIELLIELFEIRFSFAILYQYFSYLIGFYMKKQVILEMQDMAGRLRGEDIFSLAL